MKESTRPINNGSDLSAGSAVVGGLAKDRKSTAAPSLSNSHAPGVQEGAVWIAKSSRVEGRIEECDTCVVAGVVKGFIASRHVEVQADGHVEGEAHAENAIITGQFEGQLTVSGLLRLKSGAQVTGEITYGEIEIESGARLIGHVQTAGVAYKPAGLKLRHLLGFMRN